MSGRESARSSEWAQHFSNASCLTLCGVNATREGMEGGGGGGVLVPVAELRGRNSTVSLLLMYL